jgi:ATP-dependent exoDNAse (exonuclease V) alpha subunit
VGDAIRVTANGKTLDGRHRLNNGSLHQVKGFDRKGNIILANGWVVGKDFGHLTHGYLTTSHAAQGKTVDRVLIAMGRQSAPAINAEQFYVSVSRGRESARIFTGMAPDEIRHLIQRSDRRKSATEFMGHAKPRVKAKSKYKLREFMQRVAKAYRQLRDRASAVLPRPREEQERSYER